MTQSTISAKRASGVTVGLLIAGGAIGAMLGVGLLAVLGLVVDGPGGFPYVLEAFILSGAVGTILGALGLPLVGWGMLRHLPLGRVVAETSIGTIVGGTVGLLASGLNPLLAVGGALAGFVAAAVQLRFRQPSDAGRARTTVPSNESFKLTGE